MNKKFLLTAAVIIVVAVSALALYYATQLSGIRRPTTTTPTPTTDELDAETAQTDEDLDALDEVFQDFNSVDPTQDNLGI